MSITKYANAVIEEPVLDRAHWAEIHGRRASQGIQKFAAKVTDPSKFILTHCTIMASVACEDGHEDWLIKPECSHLVNNNDDAWENTVLAQSYKTFQGSFNFVEHYQNSKASKGYIVDSILRKIKLTDDVWVYYCDILVATDLKHTQLVTDIKSGKVKYLSMGCVTDLITCSYCGASNDGIGVACSHLANYKGRFLSDHDGVPRRVAELCGHKSLPGGGVRFVEASWVATPAFPGASNRSVVSHDWEAPDMSRTASGIIIPNGMAKAASAKPRLSDSTDGQGHIAQVEIRRLR
jgi:hypothetical protein